ASLNRVIRETDAGIVVSSTWRRGETRTAMQAQLSAWGIQGHVVGLTPVLECAHTRPDGTVYMGSADMGTEIRAGLDELGGRWDIENYVILDDEEAGMGEDLKPFLVQTDFEVGLTEGDADLAIKILTGAAMAVANG